MKTSNIILLSFFALAIISLFVNAFQFKNLYESINWDDPYNGCIKLNIPNVRSVYLVGASKDTYRQVHGIKVIKGDTYMFATSDTSRFTLTPTDSGLVVSAKSAMHPKAFIVLPTLDKLNVRNETALVSNFDCDSLQLCSIGEKSSIELDNCKIDKLSAQSDFGEISLQNTNTVKNISLRLCNRGHFTVVSGNFEVFSTDADPSHQ
jgi:hypothetical protein